MVKRKIKQKNSAVSEVLDTVLLLGIAVALFSVVSIVVLSYPFNPSAPTVNIIGWVEEGTDGFSNILLEHRGGESLDLDTPVIITIAGSQVLIDDQIPTAGDLLDYIAIQDTISPNYWNIGEKLNYSVGNLAGKQVTVTVIDKKSNSVILMGTLQEGISSPPTLTINVVGGGSVAKVPDQATYAFDTIVTLTPTADPGWTFDSWGGSDAGDLVDNGDGTWSITMDDDKSITANFIWYTLSITINGDGSVTKNPNQPSYAGGTIVTLTPTADSGWTFDSWGGSDAGDLVDNGDGTWSITMDDDKSVTATFTQDQYYLSITTDFSGSVVKDPDQATYTYGNVVVLTPVPNSGWGFGGWSGPDSGDLVDNGDGTWSITMDDDKSVTATFTQNQYLLSISIDGSGSVTGTGINCPGDCSETYLSGTIVTLTPTADPGWTFDSWSGPDSGDLVDNYDGTWDITMNDDKSINATFYEPGSITVIKDAVPNDPQSFGFTGDLGSFTLVDNGGANSRTFTDLHAGTYTVTETVPSGWYLTDITIVDPSGGSSSTLPTVTLLNDGFEVDLSKWNTNWDLTTSQSTSPTHSIEGSSDDDDLISNDLNTVGASSISITFRYRVHGVSGNDDVYVQYYDGSTYDNIDEIGIDTQDTWLTYSHTFINTGADVQYFINNFRLKIEGTSIDNNENLWIDDVLITKEVAGKATIVLSAGEDVTVTFTNNKIPQTITLRPNAVGQYSNLGRNGGSNNYGRVYEVSSDGDGTYVYQALNGQSTDTYNIKDPSYTGTITQITIHALVRLNSATGHMHLVLRTGTTDTIGIEQSLTSSYVDKTQTWSTNPVTGTAWTWSDITSLQIGIALQRDSGGSFDSIRCTQVWVEVTYIP